MSGLIAPPDGVDPENAEVAADGWFPAIKLADIRDTIRLGEGAIPTPRLKAAIEGAILSCLRALHVWRSGHAAAGIASLALVKNADGVIEQLGETPKTVMLWERAVRYHTGAELADQHRDIAATDEGMDRAEEKAAIGDDYRRLAYAAIADLLSIGAAEPEPRNRVSLV